MRSNRGLAMSKKRILISSCFLYLLFFMADAFMTSYYALYFIENELSSMEQSILLGIIPFALMLGCLLLSQLSKSRKAALYLFRACALMEILLAVAMGFVQGFIPLLITVFFVGFFNGAPFSFIEGFIVPALEEKKVAYSWVRLFGTIGYIVALFSGFLLLTVWPIRNCYWLAAGLFAIAFGLSFVLNAKSEKNPSDLEQNTEKTEEKRKFWSKSIILFFVSQLLLFGSFNAMGYLLPVRLNQLGMTDSQYSLVRSISLFAELGALIVIPLFAKRLSKNKKLALILGGVGCMLASLVGAFVNDMWVLGYLSLILSALGKSLFFAFEASFLTEICGEAKLGKALAITNGVVNLTSSLLNMLSSTIYESLGFSTFFILVTLLELSGLVVFRFVYTKKNTEKQNAEESSIQ